jgi:hypothetical protein
VPQKTSILGNRDYKSIVKGIVKINKGEKDYDKKD